MKVEIEQLKQIYETTMASIKISGTLPILRIEFYPYVGINNRIRLRDEVIHVRISDALADAPLEIHRALAEILLRKLYRKKVPGEITEQFSNFLNQTEMREKSSHNRKTRGRKVLNGSQGTYYDLDEIFTLLNQIYFQNAISKPTLTWSANNTYRILGHHDSIHQTIAISKSLDDLRVPRFVVEYVVYHEMLHIKHPTRFENGKRYSHTPAFRRDEKYFAFFNQAEKWIEENAHQWRKTIKGQKGIKQTID